MKRSGKGILEAAFPLTALLAIATLAPVPAHANPCTVTSLADSGSGTLRALIADTTCDFINFASFSLPAIITLTSGELGIARNLTINGPGATQMNVKRDANAVTFGIFRIDSGDVTINGLTISNGFGGFTSDAGGIHVGTSATVTLAGSTVSGSKAYSAGGIVNWGTMKIINSTISGNACDHPVLGGRPNCAAPGGILNVGQMALTGSTVSGNQGYTGGIENDGLLTITNSTLSGNFGDEGGAIRNTFAQLTITGARSPAIPPHIGALELRISNSANPSR